MDWNVVATSAPRGYRRAWEFLARFGLVQRTDFYNVLAMEVEEAPAFLEQLRQACLENPPGPDFLARAVALTHSFNFQTPEEFRPRAREAVLAWAPGLAGKGFHVRMHRRGFRGKLPSPEQETWLDQVILEELQARGLGARVDFTDPEAIIVVETIGPRAGLALYTREQRERYPFLRLD